MEDLEATALAGLVGGVTGHVLAQGVGQRRPRPGNAAGEGGLARAGRADEDDHAGLGDPDGDHAAMMTPRMHPPGRAGRIPE